MDPRILGQIPSHYFVTPSTNAQCNMYGIWNLTVTNLDGILPAVDSRPWVLCIAEIRHKLG
jgi:hypothetical protein